MATFDKKACCKHKKTRLYVCFITFLLISVSKLLILDIAYIYKHDKTKQDRR